MCLLLSVVCRCQYADSDTAEDFKVTSLINMTQGCKVIGLPFSQSGHSVPFDKMIIEKWPIIQASAVEDFGGWEYVAESI